MNKGGGTGNFKLTPEQIQEASQSFDTIKLHALAKRYGVSHKTLTASLRRAGLLKRKKQVRDRIHLSPEQLQTALEMHQEKKTLGQISERLDMCRKIIARDLKLSGQYHNQRGPKPKGIKPKQKNYAGGFEPHWSKDLSADFLSRRLIAVST